MILKSLVKFFFEKWERCLNCRTRAKYKRAQKAEPHKQEQINKSKINKSKINKSKIRQSLSCGSVVIRTVVQEKKIMMPPVLPQNVVKGG